MEIFDDLIQTSDSFDRVQVSWTYVTLIGYNSRNEPSFDDSTTTIETFYATFGEVPDYNSVRFPKEFADMNQALLALVLPGDRNYNEFIHEGIRDRLVLSTDTSRTYEAFELDTDTMWFGSSKVALLREVNAF